MIWEVNTLAERISQKIMVQKLKKGSFVPMSATSPSPVDSYVGSSDPVAIFAAVD